MTPALPAWRAPAPVARWLAAKTSGERRAVTAVAILVGAALLWAVVWQPMLRDTEALRLASGGNATALAAARKMTEEAAGLARTSAAPAPADTRASLDRALGQQNLRGAVTQLEWKDGRAHLVFAAVGYDALITALEVLQRDARVRVVEATITARVEPGMVRADITLAR